MKQKNLITVVTDHQLTADTIAKAIGANETHEGYYFGNGYAVTWTGGEIIEATFSPMESFCAFHRHGLPSGLCPQLQVRYARL